MTTILVVDDEPPIVDLVRFTLEDADVRVVEAADGAEALVVARQTIPDLVLLDVHMPRLDGFEVCRQLRREPSLARIPSSCSPPPARSLTAPAAAPPEPTSI